MRSQPVDAWPQLYRSTVNWNRGAEPFETAPVPQIVVVGATDDTGKILATVRLLALTCFQSTLLLTVIQSQTADFVDLTAPGDDIKVADAGGPQAYAWVSGSTSQGTSERP